MRIDNYIEEVTKNMSSDQQKEVADELKTHILDSADAIASARNVETASLIIASSTSTFLAEAMASALSKM